MGCCYSKDDDASNNNSNKPASNKPAVANKGKHPPNSAWSTEFNEMKWKDDTINIWQRDLKNLSCHMDLPRLGSKIVIHNNKEVVEIAPRQPSTKSTVVYDIIMTIARTAGEDESLISQIEAQYFEYVNAEGSGDTSQQLFGFLTNVVPAQSKLSNILSVCHQKIVFPAFYSIKTKLKEVMDFKDQRGSWLVNLYFDNNTCTVVHSKIQSAKPDLQTGIEEFNFRWELVVRLGGDLYDNVEDITVRIAEYNIHDGTSKERVQQIQNAIETHFPQQHDDDQQEHEEIEVSEKSTGTDDESEKKEESSES